ncbi:hypothetical protein SNEBB_008911 [Seison nebaliae]|nr:hypothetical protein SNEBB_008911 [Seison nebaliae]
MAHENFQAILLNHDIRYHTPIISTNDKFLICPGPNGILIFSIESGNVVNCIRSEKKIKLVISHPLNPFHIVVFHSDGSIIIYDYTDGKIWKEESIDIKKKGELFHVNWNKEKLYFIFRNLKSFEICSVTLFFDWYQNKITEKELMKLERIYEIVLPKENGFKFMKFSKDCKKCFFSYRDGNCVVYELLNNKGLVAPYAIKTIGFEHVVHADFSEEYHLLLGCRSGNIFLLSPDAGKYKSLVKETFKWHYTQMNCVKFADNSSTFLSCAKENVVVRWVLNGSEMTNQFLPHLPQSILQIIPFNSSDKYEFAIILKDNSIYLVSRQFRIEKRFIKMPINYDSRMTYSHQLNSIISNNSNGYLNLIELNNWKLSYSFDVMNENYVPGVYHMSQLRHIDCCQKYLAMTTIFFIPSSLTKYNETLKFWKLNQSNKFEELTQINFPNSQPIDFLKFLNNLFLCTISCSEKINIRLWKCSQRTIMDYKNVENSNYEISNNTEDFWHCTFEYESIFPSTIQEKKPKFFYDAIEDEVEKIFYVVILHRDVIQIMKMKGKDSSHYNSSSIKNPLLSCRGVQLVNVDDIIHLILYDKRKIEIFSIKDEKFTYSKSYDMNITFRIQSYTEKNVFKIFRSDGVVESYLGNGKWSELKLNNQPKIEEIQKIIEIRKDQYLFILNGERWILLNKANKKTLNVENKIEFVEPEINEIFHLQKTIIKNQQVKSQQTESEQDNFDECTLSRSITNYFKQTNIKSFPDIDKMNCLIFKDVIQQFEDKLTTLQSTSENGNQEVEDIKMDNMTEDEQKTDIIEKEQFVNFVENLRIH